MSSMVGRPMASGMAFASAPQTFGGRPGMMQTYQQPTQYMSQPTYIQQPQQVVETVVQPRVVQETIVEDLVIDVNLERPTVSGGIDALGLKPTQLEPIQPTFVTPVNETVVEAPRTIVQ